MHPVLFTLPNGFSVHTYGVAIAVGTLCAVFIATRWGAKEGIHKDVFPDLGFWAIVGGVVGARLEYLRVNWHLFANRSFTDMLNVRDGGLVYYGGLIGVLVAFLVIVQVRRLPAGKVLDILAPLIPFGQMFGRIGCFGAGCCYGHETDLPWAVTFTDPLSIAPKGVPLHPTQLYEVAYSAMLFATLYALRSRKRFDGQLILLYLMIYPVLRSLNEILRNDAERGYFLEDTLGPTISNAQAISLIIATIASLVFISKWKAAGQTKR